MPCADSRPATSAASSRSGSELRGRGVARADIVLGLSGPGRNRLGKTSLSRQGTRLQNSSLPPGFTTGARCPPSLVWHHMGRARRKADTFSSSAAAVVVVRAWPGAVKARRRAQVGSGGNQVGCARGPRLLSYAAGR